MRRRIFRELLPVASLIAFWITWFTNQPDRDLIFWALMTVWFQLLNVADLVEGK